MECGSLINNSFTQKWYHVITQYKIFIQQKIENDFLIDVIYFVSYNIFSKNLNQKLRILIWNLKKEKNLE